MIIHDDHFILYCSSVIVPVVGGDDGLRCAIVPVRRWSFTMTFHQQHYHQHHQYHHHRRRHHCYFRNE
jgi:hypothetical protein